MYKSVPSPIGPDPVFQAALDWYIHPTAGNDASDGTSAGAPMKTVAGICAKLAGCLLTTLPVLHVQDSSTNLDDAAWYGFATAPGKFISIVGTPTVMFSGALTGYTPYLVNNNRTQVVDSAIATSWTASGGISSASGTRYIRKTGVNIHAPLLVDLGSKTAQIGPPIDTPETPSQSLTTAVSQFTIGDAYQVVSMPTWPGVRTQGTPISIKAYCLDMTSSLSFVYGNSTMGATYALCGFRKLAAVAGLNVFAGCAFMAGWAGSGDIRLIESSHLGGVVQLSNAFVNWHSTGNVFVGCNVGAIHAAHLASAGILHCFDNTDAMLDVRYNSTATLLTSDGPNAIVGTGNTGKRIRCDTGSQVYGGATATAVTSDGSPYTLSGVSSAALPSPAVDTSGSAIYP